MDDFLDLPGCRCCQITPEAASGGPIAKVKDGDTIVIDTVNGTINNETEGFLEREAEVCPKRDEKEFYESIHS